LKEYASPAVRPLKLHDVAVIASQVSTPTLVELLPVNPVIW